MRILILSNFGMGLYKFRKELLELLCKDNKVLTALPSDEYTEKLKEIGCTFIPFEFNRRGMNPFADVKQILRYKRLIREVDPDVVLTYTIKPNVYGGLACIMTRKPYIVNVTGLGTSIENGGILGFVSTTLYKLGLKKASCVFFQNNDNQKLFVSKKIFNGNTRIIPGSGVNLEYHSQVDYPAENDCIKLLFIGRIMRDKGINELLAAIRKLHKNHKNVTLDIIGGCDEDYESLLNADDIETYVRYHGQQFDVRPFIHSAHCTVLPSYHEGTANVLLESASAGRPVIATRVPGCCETYDDGVTGIGCDVKNVDSLVRAIEKFLSLPHSEKVAMGLAGRKKMEAEFDRNIVVNAYIEEIEKVYKQRK